MTPRDKAEQIIRQVRPFAHGANRMSPNLYKIYNNHVKQLAYVVCDSHFYSENDSPFLGITYWKENSKFWSDVKSEVNKLRQLYIT